MRHPYLNSRRLILWVLAAAMAGACLSPARAEGPGVLEDMAFFSSLGDRSTGSAGCVKASAYIAERFTQLGLEKVAAQDFFVPVLQHGGSSLDLGEGAAPIALSPILSNAISPQSLKKGAEGPLVYVGRGDLKDFNGKDISGAIAVMDMDSGKNWQNAVSLGARALIYVGDENTSKVFFQEKLELTPVCFPRFWMTRDQAAALFGDLASAPQGLICPAARLETSMAWKRIKAQNIYGVIPGTDPALAGEILLVEAFYDSTALVSGQSPGAEEAAGIASLLETARRLKEHPPRRTVLFVATSGHAQNLAGLRELMWSLCTKSKAIKEEKASLEGVIDQVDQDMASLERFSGKAPESREEYKSLISALSEEIKTQVDAISGELMQLRLEEEGEGGREKIARLADQRRDLRELLWRDYEDLAAADLQVMQDLAGPAKEALQALRKDANAQRKAIKTSRDFRDLVGERAIVAAVSLHLSSHGDAAGAFSDGWMHPLSDRVNRASAYTTLDEVMRQGFQDLAREGVSHPLADTLRPSRLRTWDSYFGDKPYLGGEVTSLAGYAGVSLVTTNDSRPLWGTPFDTMENLDSATIMDQNALACGLLEKMASADALHSRKTPKMGFSTITGRARFMRHGELFADQPAPGAAFLVYHGPVLYHAMSDALGNFSLKGVADKSFVTDKAIIEGYRFDKNGRAVWAIDKESTGKDAYRLKVARKSAETDLIMFACRQTTLFDLLEPRSFWPMTKIQLIDARLEAQPQKYWYSRIDTRSSTLATVFLPPQSRFKMTLSDTVLKKKLVLTNAQKNVPEGVGFPVDSQPFVYNTESQVARDMWALLGPRIDTLESHGIHNEKLRELMDQGTSALDSSRELFKLRQYDRSREAARKSWALASRVYEDVEKTQKDVLFGVLFYIALFVPFAFCLERLLFSYADIHRRILAFLGVLIVLIAIIYKVHPAFKLAYSPMVVVLAFFIIGLSFMVSLIILLRFEEEMAQIQKRASHVRAAEIGRWQAFAAAFFLGVSNLRRRRLRTAFTVTTLVILTFTIMSFTSIQSLRYSFSRQFTESAPYKGMLLKNMNWWNLPPEAVGIVQDALAGKGVIAPRAWLEAPDPTRPVSVSVRCGDKTYEAQGVMGLSSQEPRVTGVGLSLVGGRWLAPGQTHEALIPERMAVDLGLDPADPRGKVLIWGEAFTVAGVFSGEGLEKAVDLDGEPLTPVYFPGEVSAQLTEVEAEALESGEDVRAFQSRYQHAPADLTVIIPYGTLLAMGGSLKGIAFQPGADVDVERLAGSLVDRFRLTLFVGQDKGTFVHHASDSLSYSGVPNIAIPILIAALIVLNTMIGTVYERKKEIGIYTSVGLAPSHVAFLFVAESMAFAVLSVVLGYVAAQTAAAVLSGTSLWEGLTVNYSSLAGVAAMLLVFGVVLVSVIYPARVAARIAIPDVNRSWSLPEAEKNRISLTMPILIGYGEVNGMGGFLTEYFSSYQDISHGVFSTSRLQAVPECPFKANAEALPVYCTSSKCDRQHCLHLAVKVWLAPFDFGIKQQVDLFLSPSAYDPKYLEIKVVLVREAGETNVWKRINKVFVNQLRKQLLVWRSLDVQEKVGYEALMKTLLTSDKATGH